MGPPYTLVIIIFIEKLTYALGFRAKNTNGGAPGPNPSRPPALQGLAVPTHATGAASNPQNSVVELSSRGTNKVTRGLAISHLSSLLEPRCKLGFSEMATKSWLGSNSWCRCGQGLRTQVPFRRFPFM